MDPVWLLIAGVSLLGFFLLVLALGVLLILHGRKKNRLAGGLGEVAPSAGAPGFAPMPTAPDDPALLQYTPEPYAPPQYTPAPYSPPPTYEAHFSEQQLQAEPAHFAAFAPEPAPNAPPPPPFMPDLGAPPAALSPAAAALFSSAPAEPPVSAAPFVPASPPPPPAVAPRAPEPPPPPRPAAPTKPVAASHGWGNLVGTSGAVDGRVIPIDEKGFYIGRDGGSSQVVIENPKISKRHVWIGVKGGSVVAIDQGSTNGTYLNRIGPRIGETPLQPGDTLILADDAARFQYQK